MEPFHMKQFIKLFHHMKHLILVQNFMYLLWVFQIDILCPFCGDVPTRSVFSNFWFLTCVLCAT